MYFFAYLFFFSTAKGLVESLLPRGLACAFGLGAAKGRAGHRRYRLPVAASLRVRVSPSSMRVIVPVRMWGWVAAWALSLGMAAIMKKC